MFTVSVARVFKIPERATVVESPLNKVTGITSSAFYNSVKNSVTWVGIFRKMAVLQIWRNTLLMRVAGLQSTACNTTKNALLTKVIK